MSPPGQSLSLPDLREHHSPFQKVKSWAIRESMGSERQKWGKQMLMPARVSLSTTSFYVAFYPHLVPTGCSVNEDGFGIKPGPAPHIRFAIMERPTEMRVKASHHETGSPSGTWYLPEHSTDAVETCGTGDIPSGRPGTTLSSCLQSWQREQRWTSNRLH